MLTTESGERSLKEVLVVDLNGLMWIVLKLSGLALAVYGAVMLSGFLIVSVERLDLLQRLLFACQPTIVLVAALFLWLFPAPVTKTLIRPVPRARICRPGRIG